MNNREIPAEILGNIKRWLWLSRVLRFMQIFLGTVGTAAALGAAMFPDQLGALWLKVCLFLAALCFAIPTAFNIGGKADAMRQACRHLTTATLRYRHLPNSTLDSLIDSNSQAQEMIGGVTFRRADTNQSAGGA